MKRDALVLKLCLFLMVVVPLLLPEWQSALAEALLALWLYRLFRWNGDLSIDHLTGLWCRRVGERLLGMELRRAARCGSLGVVLIDLDDFKAINDRFGHAAGDAVLAVCGKVLRRCLRQGDIAIRWGGDEFLLAFPGVDELGATAAMERCLAALRADGIAASAGVAVVSPEGTHSVRTLGEAVARADAAMYRMKAAGLAC